MSKPSRTRISRICPGYPRGFRYLPLPTIHLRPCWVPYEFRHSANTGWSGRSRRYALICLEGPLRTFGKRNALVKWRVCAAFPLTPRSTSRWWMSSCCPDGKFSTRTHCVRVFPRYDCFPSEGRIGETVLFVLYEFLLEWNLGRVKWKCNFQKWR